MITIERAIEDGSATRIAQEHGRLFAETGAPLSARSTSIELWRRAYPQWQSLVVEVRDGDRLIACAMLGYRRRVGWLDVIRLGPQDKPGWIAARDDAAMARLCVAIRDALAGLQRPWRLQLLNLRNGDSVLPALALALPGAHVARSPFSAQVSMPAGMPFHEATSRNTRSAVAKARNRITRCGHRLDLVWVRQWDDVVALLPEVDKVHQARNRQLRGIEGLDYPATSEQFSRRVIAYAREGRVRLLTACIDGHLAAFALCIQDRNVLIVDENLASPDWLHFSPGTIANHEVVAFAWSDAELDVVDWGLGLQRYKLSGAAEMVAHHTLEAFSSKALEVAAQMSGQSKTALAKLRLA